MKRLRFDPSPWVGVSPLDGCGRLVVMTDVAQEFDPQVVQRAEDAARDDVTLDLREPILHLVEPGGVGRREVAGAGWDELSGRPRPAWFYAPKDCRP